MMTCVYTYDFEDIDDVRRVLVALRGLDLMNARLSYKRDADTLIGRASRATAVVVPRMERITPEVLASCRRSKLLPLACPMLLPHMSQPSPHWETSVCLAGRSGCLGLTWDVLDLVDAGDGNRPPIWSHISIYAGNLTTAFRFAYPTHGVRPRRLDGLFAKSRSKALFLGSYRWGGKVGTVVLAPSYPTGGEQGDHLVFRWKQGSVGFAVGLHGWEPLSQTMATLKTMIESV